MFANNNEIIYFLENIHEALSPDTISDVYALNRTIKWVVFSSNKQPTSVDAQEAL
ncbi:hypothetical protein A0J61_04425 [Choanephora cucurbitarum]|uniref:Uncharacterized protein n=1 Tax=Choanephora cucurbitarum TaxID=101091 RepID=A0A1C7NEJ9_9FUNG|nr:hypothetical protein A0J61_04425 [Choanephora cucurbitarum]